MKRLIDLIRNNIIALTATAATVDQWYMQQTEHNKRLAQEQELKSELVKAKQKLNNLEARDERLQSKNTLLDNKVKSYESDQIALNERLNSNQNRIADLEYKVESSSLTEIKINDLD